MAIITLTTDLGDKDSYVASLKGTILNQLEDVTIIDITHNINPFNIQQAAYILRNCYKDFPRGTIHIIGVDDELTISNEHLAVKINDHYFISADNGVLSLLLNEVKPQKIVQLNITQNTDSLIFASKDVFAKAACHIARGGTLEIIGKPIEHFSVNRMELKPVIEKNLIRAAVTYIDNYGNVFTNLSKDVFERVRKERDFSILFGREDERISTIKSKYKDVPVSEKLAIFGSNGLLQIAINQGKANTLLGLKFHDIIRIEFK